jgi:LacI family transcriptional regulator
MARRTSPDRQKISIHDVAREAGVALSTVSNALAGKGNVLEPTRAKVQRAADRLGYRVSVVARALRMQRTFTIGILLADVANPSSPDFLRGVEDVAERESCSLLVCNTDGLLKKQIAQMRVLLDRRVDGLVLISQYCESPLVRELLNAETPYVLLQRRSKKYRDDYVGGDNLGGITAAVAHLVEFGHKRIGFMRGPIESSAADERLDAFQQAVKRFRIDPDPSLIVQGDYQVEGGYRAAKQFFAMKHSPTAILAANDMSAIGVVNAAHELGIKIPRDLSLIGLDDIAMASFAPINLTTIALQRRAMGAAAANLLMERIRNKKESKVQRISFPMELVIRGSTGPVPTMRSRHPQGKSRS